MKRWFREEEWDEGMTRRNEAEMEEVYPSESPYLPCAVVRREGGDEGKKSGIKDGWERLKGGQRGAIRGWGGGVFQKDHLSCVRGSVFREGDSGGFWVLLSSPFNPFLHTGHVSCCRKREEKISYKCLQNIPPTKYYPTLLTISSQGTIQSEWKKWLQGSCLTGSPTAKSSLHTGHSILQSGDTHTPFYYLVLHSC